MQRSKKYNISLWTVVESIYKVVWNANTQVKYKYIKIALKYSTWVNGLSYFGAACVCQVHCRGATLAVILEDSDNRNSEKK